MSVRKSGKIIAGTPRETGGVEIGDIGFAPLGIDESLNLRRYLNGQVISQSQFTSFTNKVKDAVALYPSLAATETNWQAEKTNSKLGQCGKFVIDDTAGTIRLPCVVNAQGLVDLALIGGIKSESLPNITGSLVASSTVGFRDTQGGAFYTDTSTELSNYIASSNAYKGSPVKFNASRSSSTYQNNAPVQQEAVQYPYYIQVATGVEETLPAIREYNINTPFFFGQSMYSDVAPDNASWLVSNGQYNAKSVYPDYYDWLVEQMNKGVDRFKGTTAYQFKGNTPETEAYTPSFTTRNPVVGSAIYGGSPIQVIGHATQVNEDGSVIVQDVVNNITATLVFKQELPNIAWFTDYDFAINTTDQTFRLPLLNGSEDLPSNRYEDLTLTSTTQRFTAPANGIYTVSGVGFGWVDITNETSGAFGSCSQPRTSDGYGRYTISAKQGDQVAIFCSAVPNSYVCRFIYAKGNGSLYYYVGDTVQDASLINAGAVLGQLTTKTNSVEAAAASMPSGRYIDLTLGASGTSYTAPANGWFALIANGLTYLDMYRADIVFGSISHPNNAYAREFIPMQKGQTLVVYYTGTPANTIFKFIYAEGEE